MCNAYIEGTLAVVDLSKCPYEFGSPEFLNIHLKDLATIEGEITRIRYEEELVIELDEEKTSVLIEYANIIRQVENIMLREDVYGMKQDDHYDLRKRALRQFYDYMFMNPIMAERTLSDFSETMPEKQVYIKGYQTFRAWVNGILKRFSEAKLCALTKKTGDMRMAFLSLAGLKSLYFINSIVLDIPPNAVPMKDKDASYKLHYGLETQIYDIQEGDTFLYVQSNPFITGLKPELQKMLKNLILEQNKENFENADYRILFELKSKEYRQFFLDSAVMKEIPITPKEAIAMGREAAAWVVGLGAPIENLALDRQNVTDIYIDSENSPIYIEHRKFGICHTLYRYNRELLENSFKHIVLSEKGVRKFDENVPIVDVVLKRLTMRCHLQRPPATFDELQGALRIMQDTPFTYPQYFGLHSLSPFFAGYDDVMVVLGCSEAVLGLKGCGKTSFTAAKILSIGTKKRIIPIQDIEEIPVRAFRKRGFHIGAARVQSSDVEASGNVQSSYGKELDLVSMANALLRMGDAAVIINEVRSRLAVQGIINLLNTQPGVFLLYNLHAESLKDIQDRLELVFGIPAVSMLATDRYSFLSKIHFGRKGRIHRMVGFSYETNQQEKNFIPVFQLERGNNLESCVLKPLFIKNPEASSYDISKMNVWKMEKEMDLEFIPPALKRRAEASGVKPEQYIIQSFFKGRLFNQVYVASVEMNNPHLNEIDFVFKVNNAANRILQELEKENGDVDFKDAQARMDAEFAKLLKAEVELAKK
ncbi:MAG: ATPase, T2SS/T4P/T4SS family [Candidatus ainarchaeum sp.]|nr:ATPase, T2SS/T4P/T4SS family [Candidatus ainarchaeum sp.]